MSELDTMLSHLADVVRPIVEHIEAKPALTKDHYDDYMVAIDKIAGRISGYAPTSTSTYLAIGVALHMAGANRNGVNAALRAMGHI